MLAKLGTLFLGATLLSSGLHDSILQARFAVFGPTAGMTRAEVERMLGEGPWIGVHVGPITDGEMVLYSKFAIHYSLDGVATSVSVRDVPKAE